MERQAGSIGDKALPQRCWRNGLRVGTRYASGVYGLAEILARVFLRAESGWFTSALCFDELIDLDEFGGGRGRAHSK